MLGRKTTLKYFGIPLIFPLVALINYILPDASNRPDQPKEVFTAVMVSAFFLLIIFVIYGHVMKRLSFLRVKTVIDAALIFGIFFLLWLVGVGKAGLLNVHSFPSPNSVFDVFREHFNYLTVEGSKSSLIRVWEGYILALILGISLGVLGGRTKRRFETSYPLAKVTAHIPPVVYLPYAIAVFWSLDAAIIFMIFIGAFWPIFINTMFGVYNVEPRYIEFAKTLGAGEKRILRHVIIPAAMPTILAGCLIGLVISFVLLTAGEMVGAHSGLGFYLMYFTDVGYYDRVTAAMLLISFWVLFNVTLVFDVVQARLLRWQRKIA